MRYRFFHLQETGIGFLRGIIIRGQTYTNTTLVGFSRVRYISMVHSAQHGFHYCCYVEWPHPPYIVPCMERQHRQHWPGGISLSTPPIHGLIHGASAPSALARWNFTVDTPRTLPPCMSVSGVTTGPGGISLSIHTACIHVRPVHMRPVYTACICTRLR